MQGLKVRTPETPLYKELFATLGAIPVPPTTINKMYETLKSGAAQGQTDPLAVIELFKLYEVQKYVSMTNHLWGGFNLIANLKTWTNLPKDVRGAIERNAVKFVRIQRKENADLNGSLRPRLTEQGMVFNEAQTDSFRARLETFLHALEGNGGEPGLEPARRAHRQARLTLEARALGGALTALHTCSGVVAPSGATDSARAALAGKGIFRNWNAITADTKASTALP